MGRKKGDKNLPKETEVPAPVICLGCERLRRNRRGNVCFDCMQLADPWMQVMSVNDQEGDVKIKDLDRYCQLCTQKLPPERHRHCKACVENLPELQNEDDVYA